MGDADPPLIAVAGRQSSPRESGPHRHEAGQLLGMFSGLLTVRTDRGAWVLPTTRAVWIPPSHVHSARSHGPFAGWAAYISPKACAALPEQPRVIEVTGLLREAVLNAAEWDLEPFQPRQRNVFAVIVDEIAGSCADAFRLPMPSDARLLRIASVLADQPADPRTLDEWAEWAHAAPRTLSRRFVAETGLTFTAWRQRARLMRALELLAAGEPVTAVALELGYDNASAFIALFKRTFGATPGRYLAADVPQIGRA
ncbi:AraC family transcriptional regulator [Trinickia dinghuensis]|uniref:AraC family transcriptional regulator n=2 Tax=Trinickia dinghuensis TaxID=2291023 RepID=A0A3D8JZI3_9BURK|nr:AraC family transcriptional regulator [Trinickia dinghuensis]